MTQPCATTYPLLVDGVTKLYQRAKTPANQGISLEFRPGELTALLGHNGAGKTTLLNQAIGVTRPSAGDIRYGPSSLAQDPDLARHVCSMMPQMHAPLTGVTPLQAIAAIGRIRGLRGTEARNAANTLLEELDIARWKKVTGEKLSGGLRRLTSYAMVVIAPPPVLLIDEPTNDVDPIRRPLIWRHLRHLADRGHIVIVVTHNLLEVERNADRFVLLHGGRVRTDNTPRALSHDIDRALLTVTPRPGIPIGPLPDAEEVATLNDSRIRLTLSASQTPAAVQWALHLSKAQRAETYILAPGSLETHYEVMTHDER